MNRIGRWTAKATQHGQTVARTSMTGAKLDKWARYWRQWGATIVQLKAGKRAEYNMTHETEAAPGHR
jgi:hypothetical protein